MLPVSHIFWQFINLSPLDLFRYFSFLDCKLKTVLRMFHREPGQGTEILIYFYWWTWENLFLSCPMDKASSCKQVGFLHLQGNPQHSQQQQEHVQKGLSLTCGKSPSCCLLPLAVTSSVWLCRPGCPSNGRCPSGTRLWKSAAKAGAKFTKRGF